MLSSWMPPFAVAAFAPAKRSPAQAAEPDQASAQPVSTAQPDGAAPALAAASADPQLLTSMAHDLTAMGQQIEQLKASIAELRDSQAQMSRDMSQEFRDPQFRTGGRASAASRRSTPQAEAGTAAAAATASTAPPPYYPAYPAPPPPCAAAAADHGSARWRTGGAPANAVALITSRIRRGSPRPALRGEVAAGFGEKSPRASLRPVSVEERAGEKSPLTSPRYPAARTSWSATGRRRPRSQPP